MKVSVAWLRALSGVQAPVEEIASRLTAVGIEVESQTRFEAIEHVVVGEVRARSPHPSRDKLTLVQLFDGRETLQVVCGAKNVPAPGGRVLFARLGARIPLPEGVLEIAPRDLGGVQSCGMICSESELGIGAAGEGIFVFEEAEHLPGALPEALPEAGTSLQDALQIEDTVLELGITPNRPDCLGHVGVARELAILFGTELQYNVSVPSGFIDGKGQDSADGFSIAIEDPERCPRYALSRVRAITVGRSPFWLRYRLFKLGLRSISNLVDVTNLVLLDTGHPIHAFDADKLTGKKIVVRQATGAEPITTLDGQARALRPDDLAICDAERPVAIAGVMGGLESEVTAETTHVAIESAYFDPRSVRRTSKRTGLHTDASHRFERGVDPNAIPAVLFRATQLIAELGGGQVHAASEVIAKPIAPAEIAYDPAKGRALLGVEEAEDTARFSDTVRFSDTAQAQVLEQLGCTVRRPERGAWSVLAPTFRPDLTRAADLVEEVGRTLGYQHIPSRVPHVQPSRRGTPPRIAFDRKVREAASAAGLLETLGYAFIDRETSDAYFGEAAVEMKNPMSEDRNVLRRGLAPGLVRSAEVSLKRQVPAARLFEVGTAFFVDSTEGAILPKEESKLAICIGGTCRDWLGAERAIDLFDLKAHLEALVQEAAGSALKVMPKSEGAPRYLHPRRVGELLSAGQTLGWMGELHPRLADALDVDARLQIAELDIDALFSVREGAQALAKAPSRVPASSRDLALLIPEALPAAAISEAILALDPQIEAVEIFDLYQGEGIPEGQRSVAYRLTYRGETTLKDKELEKLHARATKAATGLGATLR